MFEITVVGRSLAIALLSCFLGIETAVAVATDEIELQVGIIQRLGAKPINDKEPAIEEVTISSTSGDSLTVSFPETKKVIQTQKIVLDIEPQPLSKPQLSERLVLSDRATFETAEAVANSWKKLGIEVEILQPGRWQVWAKRDVYSTPLVRRWLLHSLQANGYEEAYLSSEMLTHQPQATLTIAGKKYQQDEVEITSQKNLIKVKINDGDDTPSLYGGSLELQPNAFGEYTLVNHVPLETYLRGVVPYEIGASAPPQAVAAQTIIARTYALRNLRRFAADDYQLCATVHCQVYKGLSGTNPTSDRAIEASRGLVLTYQNELVDALYSSTTGGVTASFDDAWQGADRPYLQAIIDSTQQVWNLSEHPLDDETNLRRFLSLKQGFNETGRSVFRWHKTSKIKDLDRDLRRYLNKTHHPLANFTTIEWMQVQKRSPSGRILTLTIQTDKGKIQLHKNDVRSAFEAPISTLFYLEPVYDEDKRLKAYNFIGGGFGHGVGLSQYGSYNLANLGWTAAQILSFYYPQTTIQPLNDSIVFWRDEVRLSSNR
ncbi:SpoIID/LytB domain-containing protein [Myxosarcina sp. GI1]|uniref:SpoIID/LytB domain-containing protein n=1 Tax=Myxosarcina sp. GI1 TaxID=1541065 RepID=UPI00068D3420|nr:SpoIID/LytB domain-containing protein [Myxosarcina sp. GI1]